jgi:hypothetical protein
MWYAEELGRLDTSGVKMEDLEFDQQSTRKEQENLE